MFSESAAFIFGWLAFAAVAAPTPGSQTIPGSYIITYKPNIDAESHIAWATQVHKRNIKRRTDDQASSGVRVVYENFPSYAGDFDETTIAEIEASPDVGCRHPVLEELPLADLA